MKVRMIAFCITFVLIANAIKIGILEKELKLVELCKIAINDAQNMNQCTSENIQILNSTACLVDRAKGIVSAVSFHFQDEVEAFINSRCKNEMLDIASLARYWNSPVISRTISNPQIKNNTLYPTVVHLGLTSAIDFTYAIKYLADYMNISSIVLVSGEKRKNLEYSIVAGMKLVAQQQNLFRIEKHIMIAESSITKRKHLSDNLKTPSKMIVIGNDFLQPEIVLTKLNVAALSHHHYLIIFVCNQISESCTIPIKYIISNAKIIVLAPVVEGHEKILSELSKRMNFAVKLVEMEKYLATYDACYGFCFGTLYSSASDGRKFAKTMRNRQFSNAMGEVIFDNNGKRLQNYAFQLLPSKDAEFKVVMQLSMVKVPCTADNLCFTWDVHENDEKFWKNHKNTVIEPCVYSKNGCHNYVLNAAIFTVALLVLAILISLYLYQRKKNMDVYRMTWKISKNNLKVIETKQSKGNAVSDKLTNKRRILESYALVDSSKAEFMCFKQQKRILWSTEQLDFLYELKSLNHNNLTNFIGICYNDSERLYVLHTLIERASLEDFIYDFDFNMDNTFKCAFVHDILKGLQYLHKSPIGCHGMLSLKTCLIDANWVLKLTNFGVSTMLSELIDLNYIKPIEAIPYQFYITIAPELLSNIEIGRNFPKGTASGDIYSFGMMLYSIVYRTAPFDRLFLKEVIDNVIHKSLRPHVDNQQNDPLTTLICQCWSASPDSRPKLRNIQQTIETIFSSSKGNLVDQMIKMNEKYAENLEHIVAERTSLLVEAQKQTERLLCEMLPPSIAAQLKKGETIIPRTYESVTVGFCQIVDFMDLMQQCTADQVIAFLNDTFMTFDEIIQSHDAYKVETTAETYMVASGVPSENGGKHVFEIAEIALQIREKSLTYRVAAAPDWKLSVRIGFHCGPIAAGVIGIRSPRYCLFGDTVNFASRMQSNCQANQIQVAESTAKILMQSGKYQLEKRGVVLVKGKGNVNTYWLNALKQKNSQESENIMERATPDLIQNVNNTDQISTSTDDSLSSYDTMQYDNVDGIHR